ncbi:MFS transporter [Paracandidimonas soli]|nr:MFS transporter [Paracandidimonas soli]
MQPQTESFSMRIVFVGAFIVLLSLGVRATFGLFMQPMGLEFGWGRDVFSLAFAIQNLVWGAGAIFMGVLADRYGSGKTIALGALFYVAGLIGMRFAGDELTLYLTAGVLVGLGQAGTTFPIILPVVARSVPPAYRSTAMGIASAGGSMGQFAIVPTGQVLISTLDWSGALWILSMFVAAGIPLAWILRGRPAAHTGTQSLSAAIREALGHASFHFLFWSYFVCGFHTAFITLHLPAYVMDKGLSSTHGAIAIALIGLFNVLGSFYAGKLGTHRSKKGLLAAIYALRGVGMAMLLVMPLSPAVLYAFAAWMGLFWLGTVPLTQGLIGQIYGLRYAATLSGIAFMGHQIGSFIGVWMGGYAYRTSGNYDSVWMTGIALSLMAAALCLPIREKPLQLAPAH